VSQKEPRSKKRGTTWRHLGARREKKKKKRPRLGLNVRFLSRLPEGREGPGSAKRGEKRVCTCHHANVEEGGKKGEKESNK